MTSNLDMNEIVVFQVESTADWRRAKAEQFPGDSRNLDAAAELDQLAEEIRSLEGSDLHRRINTLIDLTNETRVGDFYMELNAIVSAELLGIGFHGGCESGAAFLQWYCAEFEDLLQST